MDMAEEKTKLRKLYEEFYMTGFKTDDVNLIDRIVSYPIAYLKDGKVEMCDQYPVNPAKLKAEKGWARSTDWHFDIPAINEYQAHVIASATRLKADGSVIERVHALYDFKKIDGEWKMYALAEINF